MNSDPTAEAMSRRSRQLERSRSRRRSGSLIAIGVIVVGVIAIMLKSCGTSSKPAGSGSTPEVSARQRPSAAQSSQCGRAHPSTWMGCLVQDNPGFGRLPISGLALPGAHNAGTFNLDAQSFDTQHGSACTTFEPQDVKLATVFARWNETQDETLTQQLDQGIRFIDLQVAYNGNGSPKLGWRVVQSQFSKWPLYDYLDQIAEWAKHHPSELVLVDFRNVCYDNQPSQAIADGLFSNFATRSDVGGGSTTMADVAYDAGDKSASFANTTIDKIVKHGGGRHNVVVLLPSDVRNAALLATKYHVRAVFTTNAGGKAKTSSPFLPVARTGATVSPTTESAFASASAALASTPIRASPALGSLTGKGLSEVGLHYTFDPSKEATLFDTFGGLIQSTKSTKAPHPALPSWETRLWDGASGAITRNQILATWGHRANVVLADGVENAGYIPAVIALNAK